MSSFYVAQVLFFIVECGITCFLCAMCALCMYSKFRHHPHPLDYSCAEFRFCHGLHCWASPWRKISHSPHLFDMPGTKLSLWNNYFYLNWVVQANSSNLFVCHIATHSQMWDNTVVHLLMSVCLSVSLSCIEFLVTRLYLSIYSQRMSSVWFYQTRNVTIIS